VIAREQDVAGTDARLVEAAATGEKLEVVLVLRGSVRRAAGSSRWRIRVAGGRVVTFAAEWLVAATHLPRRRR
jgi:TolB-like protein